MDSRCVIGMSALMVFCTAIAYLLVCAAWVGCAPLFAIGWTVAITVALLFVIVVIYNEASDG